MGYLGRSPTPSPIDSSDIPDDSIDASKIIDGAIAVADVADGAITEAKIADAAVVSLKSGRKNLIINGGMQVAQRGTSALGVADNGYDTVDRFWTEGASTGALDSTQDTDVPTGQGFSKSFKVSRNTALVKGATDYTMIGQKIEGQDLTHLSYGTSSAKTITISFWCKSSTTGNYALNLYANGSGTARINTKTYSVNAADTWERKTITYTGDASGLFPVVNTTSLWIQYMLRASDAWVSSNTTEWENYGTATKYAGAHAVDIFANANGYFKITGVQLEVGSVATDFEHRSYGEELALCQRYYQAYGRASSGTPFRVVGSGNGSNTMLTGFLFQEKMRSAPTIAYYGGGSTSGSWNNYTNGTTTSNSSSTVTADVGDSSVRWNFAGNSSNPGSAYWIDVGISTSQLGFTLDAEL